MLPCLGSALTVTEHRPAAATRPRYLRSLAMQCERRAICGPILQTCTVIPLLDTAPDYEDLRRSAPSLRGVAKAVRSQIHMWAALSSNLGQHAGYPELFVILLRPSRQILGECHYYAMTAFSQTLLSLPTVIPFDSLNTDSVGH
jgi:hypothetical protein